MYKGHLKCVPFGFFAGLLLLTNLYAESKIAARILDTGQVIRDGVYTRTVVPHQMVGIEFSSWFRNDTATPQLVKMNARYMQTIPDFMGRWEDHHQRLNAGEETAFKDTVFVHMPQNESSLAFTVETVVWDQANQALEIHPIDFQFSIDAAATVHLQIPYIENTDQRFACSVSERQYFPGTSIELTWEPAQPTADVRQLTQDLYYFDIANPANLSLAVSGLYKGSQAARAQTIHGLQDGHTYGYTVKAIYETDDQVYTLYSDVVYATQDQSPPYDVYAPQVNIDGFGQAVVNWTAVDDRLIDQNASGVAAYRVYRAIDSGPESIVATLAADQPLLYIDPDVIVGVPFYYRVQAVDAVGNVGEGMPSEPLFQEGDPQYPTDDDNTGGDETQGQSDYVNTPVDTLWLDVEPWVRSVRFQAVRENTGYFDNPPAAAMRVFDSGWIDIDAALTLDGKPGKVYFVYDYSKMANGQTLPDLNQVSGKTYYRRAQTRDISGTVFTTALSPVMLDLLPPGDIRNLEAMSVIQDAPSSRPLISYNDWSVALHWDEALDDASGIENYAVYRQILDVDAQYRLIGRATENHFVDDQFNASDMRAGLTLQYRILPTDGAGNTRDLQQTAWEGRCYSLSAPTFRFAGMGAYADTLFSNTASIDIDVRDFVNETVSEFVVSMNDVETTHAATDPAILSVALSARQFSRIRVRAIMPGGRSSVWSEPRVISMQNLRPDEIQVHRTDADSASWLGHLYVQWNRASLDNDHYVLERSTDGEHWDVLYDHIVSDDDTIRIVDRYAFNESAQAPGDSLVAYKSYAYRAKMIGDNGIESPYSDVASNFCGRPPEIINDALISDWNGGMGLRIQWKHASPRMASGWVRTRVAVSRDSLSNVIYVTEPQAEVINDQSFVFGQDIALGHNYIFRIQESTENPTDGESNWSKPYTINLATLDSLFIQAQPRGKIFVHWGADPLLARLPVAELRLIRTHNTEELVRSFAPGTPSFMEPQALVDGNTYTYRLEARNALGQILAWGERVATADAGRVYVPEKVMHELRYFHGDSLTLDWAWQQQDGSLSASLSRGAQWLQIQTSSSAAFPDDPTLTVTTAWFSAESHSRSVGVPATVDNNNERVYCRITARDRWGNPAEMLWSEGVTAIYDDVLPTGVTSFAIDNATSYYAQTNQVRVNLSWEDHSLKGSEPLVANVHGYWIIRKYNTLTDTAGFVQADPGQSMFAFQDTALNVSPQWQVSSMDSAGNSRPAPWLGSALFVPTPLPPVAISHQQVDILPLEGENLNYQVEVATDARHFIWGHEMGLDDPENRLLCISDWQNTLSYTCSNGWGATVRDTTWFRVKAKAPTGWESGWSEPAIYTDSTDQQGKTTGVEADAEPPRKFTVLPNYPNPFNGETRMVYGLHRAGDVSIVVYTVNGRQIACEHRGREAAGQHEWTWHARGAQGEALATGLYFAVITVQFDNGRTATRSMKMMYLK